MSDAVSYFTIPEGTDSGRHFYVPDTATATEARSILFGGLYDFKRIAEFVGQGPKVIVDIGANIGAFTVACHAWFPGSLVHSFEPRASTFSYLTLNTRTLPSTTLHQCGLGLGERAEKLNICRFGTVGDSIGASLYHGNGWPSEEILVKDAGQAFDEAAPSGCDILKIDTEGCEIEILSSLGPRLAGAKVVVLEYHSEEDRREIDRRLGQTHHLFLADIANPHRGQMYFTLKHLTSLYDHMLIFSPGAPPET